MIVGFEIPGKPFAKQRPRYSQAMGRAYTPGETVKFERQVGQIAMAHFSGPMSGPLKLTVMAIFETPESWSKKKTAAMQGQHHTQRPDLDNCIKAIKDGLNRIAWADDCQVASVEATKLWGGVAKTLVTVEPLNVSD